MPQAPIAPKRIAIVADISLSPGKGRALAQKFNAIRSLAQIELLKPSTTEDQLLARIQKETFDLILVPWFLYLEWSKVDLALGATRTKGPIFAGYIAEDSTPAGIAENPRSASRGLIFQIGNMSGEALRVLVGSLIHPEKRSGIECLLDRKATFYYDQWYQVSLTDIGERLDALAQFPEIQKHDFQHEVPYLRQALLALWSLVYEEGPGRTKTAQPVHRAYFQLGIDSHLIAIRLCFSMQRWKISNAVNYFWPTLDSNSPTTLAAQQLLQCSDLLRLHIFSNSSDVEITLLFFKRDSTVTAHQRWQRKYSSFWIDPLDSEFLMEPPLNPEEVKAPANFKSINTFLNATPLDQSANAKTTVAREELKDRALMVLSQQVKELKNNLESKTEELRFLRMGGVGTPQSLTPPEAETLLEAFRVRYDEVTVEIRDIERKLRSLERNGALPSEVNTLNTQLEILIDRQKAWMKILLDTLQDFQAQQKAGRKKVEPA